MPGRRMRRRHFSLKGVFQQPPVGVAYMRPAFTSPSFRRMPESMYAFARHPAFPSVGLHICRPYDTLASPAPLVLHGHRIDLTLSSRRRRTLSSRRRRRIDLTLSSRRRRRIEGRAPLRHPRVSRPLVLRGHRIDLTLSSRRRRRIEGRSRCAPAVPRYGARAYSG